MIICIVGPTGVGKTKLSEELAKKYNGIVVNADAMQVYKYLDIGTAKITPSEMGNREHYLFDIKNPDESYTVCDYQSDFRKIKKEHAEKNIILVGGTGLYIKAALFNYEFSDNGERLTYDGYSNEELYKLLEQKGQLDGIHINNRVRMISRLNSTPNNNLKDELLFNDVYFIGLTTDRENLYKIIDERVDKMFESGLLSEVSKLYKKYGKTKSLATGIGYKELIEYLDGNINLDDARNLIKKRSRNYAKRQYTWFNNQMNIEWFNVDYYNFDNTIEDVSKYLWNQIK